MSLRQDDLARLVSADVEQRQQAARTATIRRAAGIVAVRTVVVAVRQQILVNLARHRALADRNRQVVIDVDHERAVRQRIRRVAVRILGTDDRREVEQQIVLGVGHRMIKLVEQLERPAAVRIDRQGEHVVAARRSSQRVADHRIGHRNPVRGQGRQTRRVAQQDDLARLVSTDVEQRQQAARTATIRRAAGIVAVRTVVVAVRQQHPRQPGPSPSPR